MTEHKIDSNTPLPVLPLRDIVVFPNMIVPLFVGRDRSVRALEEVMNKDKQILLVAQKDAGQDEPGTDDIYRAGSLGNVLQLLKLPDGTVKVLVEGVTRVRLSSVEDTGEYFQAKPEAFIEREGAPQELEALVRAVITEFEEYVKLNKKIPPEVLVSLAAIDEPARLADTIASHLNLKVTEKQELLEMDLVDDRLERLYQLMENEIGVLQVEKRIRSRVKRQMEKTQREYYLNEQMKAIQKELGESEDGNELTEFEEKIKSTKLSKEAKEKAEAELKKLKMMSPMSAEATVIRNYLDLMLSLPWQKKTRLKKDLGFAMDVLDHDHFGLEKVKERIVEHLAVQQRVNKIRGPILCLVGPPGVGKTSLAESIARATGRTYVRMALGGVRDEAEIRGHRRTYIGALPGKIIQGIKKSGSCNPLFLLDEIDKLGNDFRGDPSSALLEVLDPAQNSTFQDHYLEVDFDLSDVMFITTSNSLNIQGPLRDRMEIIRLSGYTEQEKLEICKRHLIPKAIKENGLKKEEVVIKDEAIQDVIRYYTREAGVRSLERSMQSLCRKAVRELLTAASPSKKKKAAAEGKTVKAAPKKIVIDAKKVGEYLGVRPFAYGEKEKTDQVGLVTGLAWTEVGGDILPIEAMILEGKGREKFTGKLGDVMQESIAAAASYVRSRAESFGLDPDYYQKTDIHIHVPDGATPKDGPSAGLAMATAIVSALTKIPVRSDVAMTGEISLRGNAMPIGGLKEKLLAALRGGIKKVIIPRENEKDLQDIPQNVKDGMDIVIVDHIDEVLKHALVSQPKAKTSKKKGSVGAKVAASKVGSTRASH
ncbi:MAG: endopeptidase La [Proteobacteria bacterium]|nr:endopeptidase La [Pseudomonadota bacterium]